MGLLLGPQDPSPHDPSQSTLRALSEHPRSTQSILRAPSGHSQAILLVLTQTKEFFHLIHNHRTVSENSQSTLRAPSECSQSTLGVFPESSQNIITSLSGHSHGVGSNERIFQSIHTLRTLSQYPHCTLRAPSEHSQSCLKAPSELSQSTLIAPSDHSQSNLRTPSERPPNILRAPS